MRTSIRILVLIVMLMPLAVTSTTPARQRWYQFYLSGILKSVSDASVANYTVAAMEKIDGSWRMVHSCQVGIAEGYGGTNDLFLTTHNGRFSLSVWSCAPIETIAAAIVLPDTIVLGTPIDRTSLYYQEFTGTRAIEEDGFLCNHTDYQNYIQGYMYDVDSVVVNVP
jgi:hypothetical protein